MYLRLQKLLTDSDTYRCQSGLLALMRGAYRLERIARDYSPRAVIRGLLILVRAIRVSSREQLP